MTKPTNEQIFLAANTIRGLAIDAIQAANSGHPGAPMGLADIAAVLWLKYLKIDPTDAAWEDRDRFVLSGGHGSMLLYALLHLAGYPVSLDDLKQFRQLDSLTPGHPERGHTPGAVLVYRDNITRGGGEFHPDVPVGSAVLVGQGLAQG